MREVKNCPVCVVGGAGFLGSHLTDLLLDHRGCEVLVVDNLVAGRREWVDRRAHFAHADITESEDHLRWLFKTNGIRFVFNLAAWPYINDSFSRPLHVFNVNAAGAIKVINAAQEAGCEGILQISSAELYGEGSLKKDGDRVTAYDGFRIDEEATVKPHSTYGAAKAAVDWYGQTAWRERETPVVALRQFNCVGERETHPYVVPEIISQLAKSQKRNGKDWVDAGGVKSGKLVSRSATVKLGNNSFRDFLYAGDAVRVMIEALERGQWGEVYNSGSEAGIKVYDLAKLIGKVMGFADVKVERDEARVRPWEIWHLQSDNGKLRAALSVFVRDDDYTDGFVPLEEALRRTVAWFDGNGRRWPWEGGGR